MTTIERVATLPVTLPPPMFALRPGDVIGDSYRIGRLLGRGGMGEVWAADDLELQRPVAIKTTLPGAGAQLRREARALAQVHHTGVVAVYRLGSHRGAPFMVMERLFGSTLAEQQAGRTAGRGVELDEGLELLIRIADGLAALHEAGIAHLDLKPGNVILCGGGRVVLVDLGVMEPEVTAGPRDPCGTPLYMAPELIDGALAPGRAHLADLYSFGALAHELVGGRPPFLADDIPGLLALHLAETPPDVRARRPEVPARLALLIRSCLAKSPDERPTRADELAWELRAIRAACLRRPTRP